MAVTFPTWLSKASEATHRLADQPWLLFALLLALNAVGRPCSITAHDARLYSLQALNQAEHGAYANDVFLSYGSQDQFSLFSHLVGPLVATLGLRWSFFLLYLVFNTLFLVALFRLVRALIDDTVISTLALIFLVTASLAYGGHEVFTVHEQFFTPRTIASALTLFALERLLHQRFTAAFFLLLAGMLVHPLMSFGGVLIWTGCVACRWLSPRVCVGLLIAAALGGVTLLCLPSLATRLFGSMDEEWHQQIRLSVGYNYPDGWTFKNWLNLAVSFALPIVACFSLYREDTVRQRFLLVVTIAGAVGFLATVVASLSPYALLFQGQPYRVLWILKVLQVPLGFWLIVRWSQASVVYARIAALALVGFFCVTHYNMQELTILGLLTILSLSYGWARADAFDWWYPLARGFVLGALGWTAFRGWVFLSNRAMISECFDLNEWVLFDLINPVVWLVAFSLAAAWRWQAAPNQTALRWTFAAIGLLTPLALFATELSTDFQLRHTRHGQDMALVREFIQANRAGQTGVPAVYDSEGRPDLLWIDVRATSYFSIVQTAGVMFNRKTAEEIQRRITLINKFELVRQRQREIFLDEEKKIGFENLLKVPFNSPAPTQDDLAKLCREPGLDYVVIPQEFPGLYSAGNGRIYVYECQKVRTALRLTTPEQTVAVAAR